MRTIISKYFLHLVSSLPVLLHMGCSAIPLDNTAASVNVYFSLNEKTNCTYIGTAIGSDGTLVTYLFTSNDDLTRGALNDIRNHAAAMGGDTVFIQREQVMYTTTTTFLGTVYKCK